MPRPREFDTDRVLDSVMDVFWMQGYQATSIDDLTAHTGLTRSSLYNAFGGKRDLFLTTVERYRTEQNAALVRLLETPGPARKVIRDALRRVAADVQRCGCLVTNTAVEVAPSDSAAARGVNAVWSDLESAFGSVIARGKETGEIDPGQSTETLSRYFLGIVQAAAVLAKAGRSEDDIVDVVDLAVTVLH